MKQANKKEKKQGTKTERGGDKCMKKKKRVLMGKSDNHKAHKYKKKKKSI